VVHRAGDPDPGWTAVDDYIIDRLIPDDPTFVREANAAAGLPDIDVSVAQGKFLHLLARASGARRVLEIGTLGGYSTVWLARAVGTQASSYRSRSIRIMLPSPRAIWLRPGWVTA
jgi:predicted O-methyltransferase YrrM